MPKLLIESDPYQEELPFQEDFKKHFYGTIALVCRGKHAGKYVVFPHTTYPCNDSTVPRYAFCPITFNAPSGTKYALISVLSDITYNDLSQTTQLEDGWYLAGADAVGFFTKQSVQWKVGRSTTNTIFVNTPQKRIPTLGLPSVGDRITLHSFLRFPHMLLALAQLNAGEPVKWKEVETRERTSLLIDSYTDKKCKTRILGQHTVAMDGVVWFGAGRIAMAVLVRDEPNKEYVLIPSTERSAKWCANQFDLKVLPPDAHLFSGIRPIRRTLAPEKVKATANITDTGASAAWRFITEST